MTQNLLQPVKSFFDVKYLNYSNNQQILNIIHEAHTINNPLKLMIL